MRFLYDHLGMEDEYVTWEIYIIYSCCWRKKNIPILNQSWGLAHNKIGSRIIKSIQDAGQLMTRTLLMRSNYGNFFSDIYFLKAAPEKIWKISPSQMEIFFRPK